MNVGGFQRLNGFGRIKPDFIGNAYPAGKIAVNRQIDNRSRLITVIISGIEFFHQPGIAKADAYTVDFGRNPAAGKLLIIRNFGIVNLPPVSPTDRLGHRMRRISSGIGGQFQNFRCGQALSFHLRHRKSPFGEGSGFVEDDNFRLGQCLQIVAAFH